MKIILITDMIVDNHGAFAVPSKPLWGVVTLGFPLDDDCMFSFAPLLGGTDCCWRAVNKLGRTGWQADRRDTFETVPEDRVPPEVWAALAAWRLTS